MNTGSPINVGYSVPAQRVEVSTLDAADREMASKEATARQAALAAHATAMPLTFGKIFWAIVLGNLFTAVIVGIAYSLLTPR